MTDSSTLPVTEKELEPLVWVETADGLEAAAGTHARYVIRIEGDDLVVEYATAVVLIKPKPGTTWFGRVRQAKAEAEQCWSCQHGLF